MSYLLSEDFLSKVTFYNANKKYKFENEVKVDDHLCRMELKTEFEVDGSPATLIIKESRIWVKERKLFLLKGEERFIPALTIDVILRDTTVEYLDKILLTGNIGFGVDIKELLFGSSKNKYKMIYNGLNASLDRIKDDPCRLENFTVDFELSEYAKRGFFEEALRLRDKIGDFDFKETK